MSRKRPHEDSSPPPSTTEATFVIDGESCGPRTEIWSAYLEDEEISVVATKPIYIRCSFKHWNETCLIFLYKKVDKQWTNSTTIYHNFNTDYKFAPPSETKAEFFIEIATLSGTVISRTPVLKPYTERWFREKIKRENMKPKQLHSRVIGKYSSDSLLAQQYMSESGRTSQSTSSSNSSNTNNNNNNNSSQPTTTTTTNTSNPNIHLPSSASGSPDSDSEHLRKKIKLIEDENARLKAQNLYWQNMVKTLVQQQQQQQQQQDVFTFQNPSDPFSKQQFTTNPPQISAPTTTTDPFASSIIEGDLSSAPPALPDYFISSPASDLQAMAFSEEPNGLIDFSVNNNNNFLGGNSFQQQQQQQQQHQQQQLQSSLLLQPTLSLTNIGDFKGISLEKLLPISTIPPSSFLSSSSSSSIPQQTTITSTTTTTTTLNNNNINWNSTTNTTLSLSSSFDGNFSQAPQSQSQPQPQPQLQLEQQSLQKSDEMDDVLFQNMNSTPMQTAISLPGVKVKARARLDPEKQKKIMEKANADLLRSKQLEEQKEKEQKEKEEKEKEEKERKELEKIAESPKKKSGEISRFRSSSKTTSNSAPNKKQIDGKITTSSSKLVVFHDDDDDDEENDDDEDYDSTRSQDEEENLKRGKKSKDTGNSKMKRKSSNVVGGGVGGGAGALRSSFSIPPPPSSSRPVLSPPPGSIPPPAPGGSRGGGGGGFRGARGGGVGGAPPRSAPVPASLKGNLRNASPPSPSPSSSHPSSISRTIQPTNTLDLLNMSYGTNATNSFQPPTPQQPSSTWGYQQPPPQQQNLSDLISITNASAAPSSQLGGMQMQSVSMMNVPQTHSQAPMMYASHGPSAQQMYSHNAFPQTQMYHQPQLQQQQHQSQSQSLLLGYSNAQAPQQTLQQTQDPFASSQIQQQSHAAQANSLHQQQQPPAPQQPQPQQKEDGIFSPILKLFSRISKTDADENKFVSNEDNDISPKSNSATSNKTANTQQRPISKKEEVQEEKQLRSKSLSINQAQTQAQQPKQQQQQGPSINTLLESVVERRQMQMSSPVNFISQFGSPPVVAPPPSPSFRVGSSNSNLLSSSTTNTNTNTNDNNMGENDHVTAVSKQLEGLNFGQPPKPQNFAVVGILPLPSDFSAARRIPSSNLT